MRTTAAVQRIGCSNGQDPFWSNEHRLRADGMVQRRLSMQAATRRGMLLEGTLLGTVVTFILNEE